jgi:hypothetical protein
MHATHQPRPRRARVDSSKVVPAAAGRCLGLQMHPQSALLHNPQDNTYYTVAALAADFQVSGCVACVRICVRVGVAPPNKLPRPAYE